MPFAVEVTGTNAATAYAGDGTRKRWTVNPGRKTSFGWVCKVDGERAVFATRAEAHRVGLACHWSNQTFRTTVVRQAVNDTAPEAVTSCQEP